MVEAGGSGRTWPSPSTVNRSVVPLVICGDWCEAPVLLPLPANRRLAKQVLARFRSPPNAGPAATLRPTMQRRMLLWVFSLQAAFAAGCDCIPARSALV